MLASLIRKVVPARWRPIQYLTDKTFAETGGRVAAGPFKGMRYIPASVGSCLIPKVLGIYERELYPSVEEACAAKPRLVVDIGAAEGYYAVGLAMRNPGARVLAYEMDPSGQELLKEVCRLNGQEGHVEICGKCDTENLAEVLGSGESTYVVCDCEGFEKELLEPAAVPGLRRASILVELHDFLIPGLAQELARRFEATHEVERIWQTDRGVEDYPFRSRYLRLIPHSYLEWAVSEWRPERMSWLWMRPRKMQPA